MHTYDADRHVWRYDVGGYAWDNSELSTDIWLWLYFLRSGRADVFRFAEAMTRHTGEVDVHHLGRFAPLGSRHNVMHWGCSAKQLRISTALNRRYYYYLTADERVGDLHARAGRGGANAAHDRAGTRKLPGARERQADDPKATSRAWVSAPTGVRSRARGSRNGSARATRDARQVGREHADHRRAASRLLHRRRPDELRTGAFDIAKDPKVSVSHLRPRSACRKCAPS